jgi:hypothetical protein
VKSSTSFETPVHSDALPPVDEPLDIERLMRDIRADIAARLPDADEAGVAPRERRSGAFSETETPAQSALPSI